MHNRAILGELRRREGVNRTMRQIEGKAVIGAKRLVGTPIGAPYVPTRTGRRMQVHSVDRELRRQTIAWMKRLYEKGRRVLERWRLGDFSWAYPFGLFPPTGIRLAEPIGW